MKLITSLQMRECDRRTIAGEGLDGPIPGRVLMERAGWGITAALRQHFGDLGQRPILIFCGRGNNGGDGLVVARHLLAAGLAPHVFLLAGRDRLSPDAAEQEAAYRARGGLIEEVSGEEQLGLRVTQALRAAGRFPPLLVDALLGTGARGAPRGVIGGCVRLIEGLRTEWDAEVLAVDLPTGVDADTGAVTGEAVVADLTVTMARLKVGFLFYPARSHLGRVRVVDIGIPPLVESDVGLPLHLMTREDAFLLLPQRPPDTHKSRVGRILIVGGSPGLTGAPAMAGRAAVRAGAGLVTIALPRSLDLSLEAQLTEVMTAPCPETAAGGLAEEAESAILARRETTDVWALGPGLGRDEESLHLVRRLVARFPGPVVVDADGLSAFAGEPCLRPAGAPPPVLTPHPGEMARLAAGDAAALAGPPYEIAQRHAQAQECVLVLKGAPTVIAGPDGEVWINPTGNPGLATGGSGDVLTGIIAALLGQGLEPVDAARLGVFLHGAAADHLLPEKGAAGLAPPDLIEALPSAFAAIGDPTRRATSDHWVSAGAFAIP
ncbi:MAG: NAD(P)H-hydrate dehydratase [Candidatus Eisenbacteria sp.]|nr:NAD(P)H-hydrate dehydratase [Candidatus Eisenbacteria bacterium]